MPQFSLDSHKQVGSSIGCFFSILLSTLLLSYASLRLLNFSTEGNIVNFTVEGEHEVEKGVDLAEYGFMVAFKIESEDGEHRLLHDEDYVDIEVSIE